MQQQDSNAWPTATQVVDLLVVVFSAVVISGVNIIVSGHILGMVLSLSRDEDAEGKLLVPLWPVLNMNVRGARLVAGFAAFAISFLAVSLFWTDSAKTMFITNMQATDKPLTACQLLATLISVVGCVLLAMVTRGVQQLRGAIRTVKADDEQVDRIVGRNNE